MISSRRALCPCMAPNPKQVWLTCAVLRAARLMSDIMILWSERCPHMLFLRALIQALTGLIGQPKRNQQLIVYRASHLQQVAGGE